MVMKGSKILLKTPLTCEIRGVKYSLFNAHNALTNRNKGLTKMTDETATLAATATATPVAASVLVTEYPNMTGERSFDCATIPANVRLDFLKAHVRSYIANRLNSLTTRHQKDAAVIAWNAYNEATKADPLQSLVPKPTVPLPAMPDYDEAYGRAVADLVAGKVRQVSDEPKQRKTKDPLTAVVTDAVIREVYESRKAADPKYTFINARAEVGVDGIAYLNKLIDAKVAQGADRGELEKMRETRYVGPAKMMLGITTSKATAALPSIL